MNLMTTLADLALAAVIRAEFAGSLGVLLVLALRGSTRRAFGAELAYRLWLLPPAMALVGIFPTLADFYGPPPEYGVAVAIPHSPALLLAWALGVVAAGLVMLVSELGFRRLARAGQAGPAVMGVLWPRTITPADFAERFSPQEQALIRRHERAHIELGHPMTNLVIAGFQALSWFNPVVHLAVAAAKLDQELACDAAVIAAAPGERRRYGETLLKAHMDAPTSPFACAWSALGRHPLETRLSTLADRPASLSAYLRGAAAVALVAAIAAAGVWSAGPRWDTAPRFVWTIQGGSLS
jgi:beta-lactamase regulating signal transducer with metallopeptidase domain